jgi:hypothetical protein
MKSQRRGGLLLQKHVSQKIQKMTNEYSKIVLTSYFGSIIAVQWLDLVMRIVGTHEELHPVSVPESLALDNLAIVTTVAHRSVDPLRHHNHLFPHSEQLQVQLRT